VGLPRGGECRWGHIFAAEDRSGTWRLLYTRSSGRLALFVAKSLVGLVVPVLASVALMASSLAAGLLLVGRDPVLNPSGSLVGASSVARLVALSFLTQLPPLLALASFALMLSVVTRNSLSAVAGPVVVSLVCRLVALVDQPPLLRALLPSGGFTAWRGLWLDGAFTRPVAVESASNLMVAVWCLTVGGIVFTRRDVALR
jgi:ABC-2 type transport system permease protein